MAVGANPYGANASLNARIEAGVTGSEPLMMLVTPERSSDSPSRGRPRRAACSNAKLGAADHAYLGRDNACTQRIGLPRNASGLIRSAACPAKIGPAIPSIKPISW